MCDTPEADAEQTPEETRRAFLKLCGKIGLYTPPAMAMLLAPGQDAIAQSGIIVRPDGT